MKSIWVLGVSVLLVLGARGQAVSRGAFSSGGGRALPGGARGSLPDGARRSLPGGGVPRAVVDARSCCSRRVSSSGVRLELTGVYIDSGLLWFVFRGINRSAIDFRVGGMRFAFRDRRALKRRALQELRLVPVVRQEVAVIRSDSTVRSYYGLMPRVPGKRQELVIEWVERNGDRRMQLRVPAKSLLTAHRL